MGETVGCPWNSNKGPEQPFYYPSHIASITRWTVHDYRYYQVNNKWTTGARPGMQERPGRHIRRDSIPSVFTSTATRMCYHQAERNVDRRPDVLPFTGTGRPNGQTSFIYYLVEFKYSIWIQIWNSSSNVQIRIQIFKYLAAISLVTE